MTQVLTVAAPKASRADAIQMGIYHGWVQGQTPEEWKGAFRAQYQDAQGNLYRVFSMPISQPVIDGMVALMSLANLQRPPQDEPNEDGSYTLNMAAVNRAHDMFRENVWMPATPDPETGEVPDNPVPQVALDKIIAVIGMKGTDALAAMGLEPISSEI